MVRIVYLFRRLFADARELGQRLDVLAGNRAVEGVRARTVQHAHRALRTHAADAQQQHEELVLRPLQKSVQPNRVLAHAGVGVYLHVLPAVQLAQRLAGHKHPVAHAACRGNHAIILFHKIDFALNGANHVETPPSVLLSGFRRGFIPADRSVVPPAVAG